MRHNEVHANVRFSVVLQKLAPMEAKLAEASGELRAAQARLDECRAELRNIDDEVRPTETRDKNQVFIMWMKFR